MFMKMLNSPCGFQYCSKQERLATANVMEEVNNYSIYYCRKHMSVVA